MDIASEAIRKHGALLECADGKLKANPAAALERDARSGMMQALKGLHLDLEPVKAVGRPPASFSKRR